MHGMLRVTRPRVQSLAALVRALVSFRRRKTSSCAFVPDRSRHALTHASKQIVRPQRKSESENGDAEQRWEARAGGCERASEQWTRGGDWERRRRRGDGTEQKEAAWRSDGTGAPLSEEAIGTHCRYNRTACLDAPGGVHYGHSSALRTWTDGLASLDAKFGDVRRSKLANEVICR